MQLIKRKFSTSQTSVITIKPTNVEFVELLLGLRVDVVMVIVLLDNLLEVDGDEGFVFELGF